MATGFEPVVTGAEDVRFDLSDIYTGIDDPKIDADIKRLKRLADKFQTTFKGKITKLLGAALRSSRPIERLISKLYVIELMLSCDTGNERIQQVAAKMRSACHYTRMQMLFFDIELASMGTQTYERLLRKDPFLRKHRAILDPTRNNRKHYLGLRAETLLARRECFITEEWTEMLQQILGEQTITQRSALSWYQPYYGQPRTLNQTIGTITDSADPEERSDAQRALNNRLKRRVATNMGRALNVVIGSKNDEDQMRGYKTPMAVMNACNELSESEVSALHESVLTTGKALAQRYFRLMAAHQGTDVLRWSDHDAMIYPDPGERLEWKEGVRILSRAFRSFSPKMWEPIKYALSQGWVDAPEYSGKCSYNFNMTLALPRGLGIRSYTLLHFDGSIRALLYAAHEFGHLFQGHHGASRNGPLLMESSYIGCEIGSILGEMIVFQHLLRRARTPEDKFFILTVKMREFLFNVTRTIARSCFEQRIHELRKTKKLTTRELRTLWVESMQEVFGPEGETFVFKDMDYLWANEALLLEPFYLYSYAYSELFVQSLYARKHSMGKERFVRKTLRMLSRTPIDSPCEWGKPFGFTLESKEDFDKALKGSFGKWIARAEKLSAELGVEVV